MDHLERRLARIEIKLDHTHCLMHQAIELLVAGPADEAARARIGAALDAQKAALGAAIKKYTPSEPPTG